MDRSACLYELPTHWWNHQVARDWGNCCAMFERVEFERAPSTESSVHSEKAIYWGVSHQSETGRACGAMGGRPEISCVRDVRTCGCFPPENGTRSLDHGLDHNI